MRITPVYLDAMSVSPIEVKAEIVKSKKRGWLNTGYLPEGKFLEMLKYGYAYTMQPAERI